MTETVAPPPDLAAGARFPVEGMTCASCVNRIERYLRKVEGVTEANVNLATESASVTFDPARVSLEDLGRAVEAAGYEARLDRVEQTGTGSTNRTIEVGFSAPRTFALDIEGMTCASCVNRIERYLGKLDGVTKANVNLATERATVVAGPSVTVDQIIAAVEAAGYDARLVEAAGYDARLIVDAERGPQPAGGNPLAEEHAVHREVADAPETSFQQRHLADTRRRLIVGAILTTPLLLGLAQMTVAPFLPAILANPWFQLALATPVQFWVGLPFYRGAWKVARHRATDMNTLIAVGTSAAYFYSLAAIIFPSFFRAAGLAAAGAPPLYFDTASAIITLILLGRFLEARARSHTSDAIRRLIGLTPRTARIVRDGVETGSRATSRSRTSFGATSSSSGRASVCPWTASSATAVRPSTRASSPEKACR